MTDFEILIGNFDCKKKKVLSSLYQLQQPEKVLLRYQKQWIEDTQGCIQQEHWPVI